MPWKPTISQQMNGTGGVAVQNQVGGMGPSPFGNGSLGVSSGNPFDAAARFNSMYGGLPAHRVLSMTENGTPPTPQNTATTGVASTPVQPGGKVSAPPAQAGAMNAAMPGIFNGNPTSGHPSSDNGFQAMPRFPQGGGQKPAWAKPALSAPPATPPAPPVRTPATGAPGMEAPLPITSQMPTMGAAAAEVQGANAEPDAPAQDAPIPTLGGDSPFAPPPKVAQKSFLDYTVPGIIYNAVTDSGSTTGDGPAGHQPPANGKQFNYGGQSYVATKDLPPDWASRTKQQKDAWVKNNATVANSTISAGLTALKGIPELRDITLPDKGMDQPTYINDKSDITKLPGDLYRLADVARQLKAKVDAPDQAGTATQGRKNQEYRDQLQQITDALKAYNVFLGDAPTPGPTPGDGSAPSGLVTQGGGTHGGYFPNQTQILDANGNPIIPPAPPPGSDPTTPTTPTSPVPGPDNGGVVGGPAYPGTNLDLSNVTADQMPQNKQLMADLYKTYGDKAPAVFEALQAAAQQQNQQNNRQSAVNLFGGAVDSFAKDPLYTGVQGVAQDILKNPTPVPWDIIRNQTVTGIDKSGENAIQGLSVGANRRGIAPGALAGMSGDIRRQQGNETSKALGDLEIQKATTDRQMQDQAMRSGLTALAGTTGANMANVGNLANFIVGDPAQYQNPYSGIASAFTNADAAQAALDQAKQAGKFGWGDAAQIIGSIASAYAGKK